MKLKERSREDGGGWGDVGLEQTRKGVVTVLVMPVLETKSRRYDDYFGRR